MKIQDLSKELTQEERAVRGGSNANIGFIGAPTLVQSGGPSLFSPSTAVIVDTPTQIQTNVARSRPLWTSRRFPTSSARWAR